LKSFVTANRASSDCASVGGVSGADSGTFLGGSGFLVLLDFRAFFSFVFSSDAVTDKSATLLPFPGLFLGV
jgi:hypothetical protein